ncbi:MAG: hypothetical protein ACRDS0_24745 [Pseudonocardiaceae bacterium]
MSWLRNGRTVEHALVAPPRAPSPETLEARLAALISFYRWQEAVFEVPVAGRLMCGAPRRSPARGLLAHLDARSGPGPSSLVRVRSGCRHGRPPLLLPQEIQAILDGCAVVDPVAGEWVGNLRDRLLFALLAETGLSPGRGVGHADQRLRHGPRRHRVCRDRAALRQPQRCAGEDDASSPDLCRW